MNEDEAGARERERAAALLELSRDKEAIVHLRRAVAVDPHDAHAYCLLALALLRTEQPEEALKAAEASAAVDPEEEWSHRLRAIALKSLGRKREARDAALEACRLDPIEPMAYVVLSDTLQATGDEAGALAAAEHAVELAPESPDVFNRLGAILLQHERTADAEAAFRAALKLDPENHAAQHNLSITVYARGERTEGLRGLERAATLDPSADDTHRVVLRAGGGTGWRRLAVGCVLGAVIAFVTSHRASLGVFLLLAAGVFEIVRAVRLRRLSPAGRALVAADARARRFDVRRWDWTWPTRLRPWWWILLQRTPPPVAAAINGGVLALQVAGRSWVWVVVLSIAMPFSLLRAWRWWRRQHPASGSWQPPA